MTVATTSITNGPYTGNGASDTYSYTFRVTTKNELSVYETTDAGVQTLLVVDSDYLVTGVGVDAGGAVVRVAGNLPASYQWYIRSNYNEDQDTSFTSQGAFYSDVHEAQMDHITFLIQQLRDSSDRSVRLDDSVENDGDFRFSDDAATRAGKVISFGSSGDAEVTAFVDLTSEMASNDVGKGASLVGIEDAAGKFTGTDVETALYELATKTDDFVAGASISSSNVSAHMRVESGTTETTSTSYVKTREFTAQRGGSYYAYSKVKSDGTYTTYMRLYKNGSPWGAERSTSGAGTQADTETLSFSENDLIQMYMKVSNAAIGVSTADCEFFVTNKNAEHDKMLTWD